MADPSTGLNLEAGGIAPLPDLFSAGAQQGGQSMTDLFTGSMMAGNAGSINAAPQDPSAPGVMTLQSTPAAEEAAKTDAEKQSTLSAAKCQVTGCTEDLSAQSRYNRRYRICDVHRKDLAIQMNGESLRFCQQCARLQAVEKFKGDRRSCQTSLELHNKRQSEGANAAVAAGFMAAPQCQVPGCSEDLLQHKVYNQRYKICPRHRTELAVEIDGQMVRFCQQCAKVHSVNDFEARKRSCKEKLSRINQRREDLKRTLEQREENPSIPMPVKCFFCQVPGCNPEPKEMKVYNIRNKVCTTHLGMAEVKINGSMQRFCRQCARFHKISEFDGLKRSCRSRLEKHNERRRIATQQTKAAKNGEEAPEGGAAALSSITASATDAAAAAAGGTPRGSKGASKGGAAAAGGGATTPAPARRTRRAAAKTPASAAPACQVPGCGKDLQGEKAYNVRYKVCAEHLTAREVQMPEGAVRFCQQCARFQPIADFDGIKRSCRQRLQKHNERGRVAYQKARKDKPSKDDEYEVEEPKSDGKGVVIDALDLK